ncbi:PHD finger protein 3 isoform X3 [Alosa alosa]|nr:PHD finger protein 3 isoform X3 [Alosa alosa]
MLSDKDPMFGSASTQFHLLDNDESNFANITGHSMSASGRGRGVSRGQSAGGRMLRGGRRGSRGGRGASGAPRNASSPAEQGGGRGSGRGVRGRRTGPGRRGVSIRRAGRGRRAADSSPPGSSSSDDSPRRRKRELLLSRRYSANDVPPSMNPVVVLRRLTVTVGGFRIELLPGPSHLAGVASLTVDQGTHEGLVCVDGMGVSVNAEDIMTADSSAVVEAARDPRTAAQQKKVTVVSAGDAAMDLGPYVNPNEVQNTNGALLPKPAAKVSASLVPKAASDQNDPPKPKASKMQGKNNMALPDSPTKHFKSKEALSSPKPKPTVPEKPGTARKSLNHPHLKKVPPRGMLKNPADLKRKLQNNVALKRPGEPIKAGSVPKVQKIRQETSTKQPVKPGAPRPEINKLQQAPRPQGPRPQPPPPHPPSLPPHPSAQQSPHKQAGLPQRKPPQSPSLVKKLEQGALKELAENEEQERHRLRKEKVLQKQRSRSARSVSVEEPELFIPDNAPPSAKKETVEEEPADEAQWDPSKHCGLCKKAHSNRFMVGCGRCDDWFHGDCVGLDLDKVQQMEQEDQEYVCLRCCEDEDATRAEPSASDSVAKDHAPKNDAQQPSKHKQGQGVTTGGVRPFRKDSTHSERRQSSESKDYTHKSGSTVKTEKHKAKISSVSMKQPSTDQIRRNVRHTLKDILLSRLKDSDLKVSSEKVAEVAKKTEKELYSFFQGTDSKYKSKYRSLTFNLKDTKNNVLFKRVLLGEISPGDLIRMSPEELASKELAAWRQRENRHTIEMIEKEQREAERRPITKITHKGEIEIENQEPMKAPDVVEVEPEPVPKAPEEPEEKPQVAEPESPKDVKDTTSLHKSHLFDLNCKICTGRMVPPVEEPVTKVVKVATTVTKRPSTSEVEAAPAPSSGITDELDALEGSLMTSGIFSSFEGRSESLSNKDDPAAFLANLECLWNGFVDMAAVAKLLTKAYPVSGTLDNLTEDLPENIQVGGRISPQIVWDYVEKIRASGTKELCVIRFTPETEEDEISYTLLYAYFSSRRRYGVVANNRKFVKDMYLIPLGATEKIPHHIVPFDGPGLESNRPNLLLGLIIRQRPKRDYGAILPMPASSPAGVLPETEKTADLVTKPAKVLHVENDFVSSLKVPSVKEATPHKPSETDDPLGTDPIVTEDSATDLGLLDSSKPLRFLPGVLKSASSKASKLTVTEDEASIAQIITGHQAFQSDTGSQGGPVKPTTPTTPLSRFIIKKKDSKTVKMEAGPSSETVKSVTDSKTIKLQADPSSKSDTSVTDSKSVKTDTSPSVKMEKSVTDSQSAKTDASPSIKMEKTVTDSQSDKINTSPSSKIEKIVADSQSGKTNTSPSIKMEKPVTDSQSAKTDASPSVKTKKIDTDFKSAKTEAGQSSNTVESETDSISAKILGGPSNDTEKSVLDNLIGKQKSDVPSSTLLVSLKDKPADVSTEVFLASLSSPNKPEPSTSDSSKEADTLSNSVNLSPDKQSSPDSTTATLLDTSVEDKPSTTSAIPGLSSPTSSPKQPFAGILKSSLEQPKPTDAKMSPPEPEDSVSDRKHSEQPDAQEGSKDNKNEALHSASVPSSSDLSPKEFQPLRDIQSIKTISSNCKSKDPLSPRPSLLNSPPYSPLLFSAHHLPGFLPQVLRAHFTSPRHCQITLPTILHLFCHHKSLPTWATRHQGLQP